jgi:acetyl esterase/lipase
MRRFHYATGLAIGLLAAGCAGGSSEPGASSATASPTPIVAEATDGATNAPSPAPAFTEASDVVYMTMSGVELQADVYIPSGAGPWPVVVVFHGLDSNGKDEVDTAAVAEEAAAQGMVVFAPSWIVWDPGPFPFTIEIFEGWKTAASCAVAFAQQRAADYGGDPSNTTIYGFSAGAGAALLAAVEPGVDAIPGCATDLGPAPVTGVVLGDGDYFLHTENFDEAFRGDLKGMRAELAALTDPSNWAPDLKARFFLWVAAEGTNSRTISDPSDASGWLAQRDPDGSIRADLDRLNQLEDGVMSFIDAGQLLRLRLAEAGIEVTLDQYPGGHTTLNKLAELVGYLKAATTP